MNDILLLNRMLQEGKCCSQALVALGLKLTGQENPMLERTSAALCMGVRSGLTCGALTGAAMLLHMFDPEAAAAEMIPELAQWFKETYGESYGGIDCGHILAGNPANKVMRCPAVVESTYRKARELLEDFGYDPEEMAEAIEE